MEVVDVNADWAMRNAELNHKQLLFRNVLCALETGLPN
jgi:hypothetical protein